MRILLMRPPYTRLRQVGQYAAFPLGIGYIAAVLRDGGYDVMIYHADKRRSDREQLWTEPEESFNFRANGYHRYLSAIKDKNHYVWKEIEETIASFKPDVLGVSVLSVEVAAALKVSQLCKNVNSACKIVWGGVHPTFLPDDCLKHVEVDYVIRNEGEYSMLELCDTLRSQKNQFRTIAGLSWKEDKGIVHNEARPPIEPLDVLPFPAWENVLYPETYNYKAMANVIFSRGCPFLCSFCSSRNFWSKKTRLRSPEKMIRELAELKKLYGTSHAIFWDDSFTINRQTIERYCKALVDSGLKISWRTATRADLIDDDLLRLMKKAGCCKLDIGVESGSERIRHLISKDITNEQIRSAFANIQKSGIGAGAFFMAGFPDETLDDLQKTLDLMQELESVEIAFNIFDPMPGSEEYEKCVRYGIVPVAPDWTSFPFWPDAHYARNISEEDFAAQVKKMVEWLHYRNRSPANRFRRNRQMIFTMLRTNPSLLVVKTFEFVKRRLGTWRARR